MTRIAPLLLASCLTSEDPILVDLFEDVDLEPSGVLEVAWYAGPGIFLDAGCDDPEVRVTADPDPAQPPAMLPDGLLVTLSVVASAYATPDNDVTCEIERATVSDLVLVRMR